MSQYDIFISHDSRDKKVANHLKDFLEDVFLQSQVYVSGQNIQGGDSWYDSIVSTLRSCKVVISIISKNSIDNNWVYFETGAGVADKKSIPLLTYGIDFSDLTKYPVSSIQARKLDDEGVMKLIRDVAKLLNVRSPKEENLTGVQGLIEKCNLPFIAEKARGLTEKLKALSAEREESDEYDEDENTWSRELQIKLDTQLEKTRIHLKSFWIELVNTKYNKEKSRLNSIHKLDIPELHTYLLSVSITSQAENYTDFVEAEKIQMSPSERDAQEHGLALLEKLMRRMKHAKNAKKL